MVSQGSQELFSMFTMIPTCNVTHIFCRRTITGGYTSSPRSHHKIHLTTITAETTGSGYLLRYHVWWRLWSCEVNSQPTIWPGLTQIVQDTRTCALVLNPKWRNLRPPFPLFPSVKKVQVFISSYCIELPRQVGEVLSASSVTLWYHSDSEF